MKDCLTFAFYASSWSEICKALAWQKCQLLKTAHTNIQLCALLLVIVMDLSSQFIIFHSYKLSHKYIEIGRGGWRKDTIFTSRHDSHLSNCDEPCSKSHSFCRRSANRGSGHCTTLSSGFWLLLRTLSDNNNTDNTDFVYHNTILGILVPHIPKTVARSHSSVFRISSISRE